jgi:carbamoyltransferase
MRVLGLAFSGHGTSACLVEDGRVVSAVNLERLTRVKFSLAGLPADQALLAHTIAHGFQRGDAPPIFDFYEVFPRLCEYLTGVSDVTRAGLDLVVKTSDNIRRKAPEDADYDEFLAHFGSVRTCFDLEHHLCHAYQAYLSSPFDDAAILTIDGTGEALERLGGESITTSLCVGEGGRVRVLSEVRAPSTVGGMYAFVTKHLGFRDEQEGNTMALASFGTDAFFRSARPGALDLHDDGTFGLTFLPYYVGATWVDRIQKHCNPRAPGEPFTSAHYDLAHGMQALTEEILVHAASRLSHRTGKTRLAMAGGVALNCVANAKLLEQTPFRELYVMPNAGDRGLAVGAALYGYEVVLGGRERHPLRHDYLGKTYSDDEIAAALRAAPDTEFRRCDDIASESAALVARGRIIGWVQGGAEFGPRALGHRSILADPRTVQSKERLDRDIKRREWFRPYAPSVLAERADEYFEMLGPSPYMLLAVKARPLARERAPGIVHVDGTARVQTVERDVEPLYHRLISKLDELTGVPIVLNTSFNGYGEPIVETPEDAVQSLHAMGLDALAVGSYLAWKAGRPP